MTVTVTSNCKKCDGAGRYMYDENHIKPCEECCTHSEGWWELEEHYGNDNGKYACKKGCGTLMTRPPSEKLTKKIPAPQTEEDLMELTKDALADVLGREPTKQEILKAHAGFKRMAFVMHEHLRHEEVTKKEAPKDPKHSN